MNQQFVCRLSLPLLAGLLLFCATTQVNGESYESLNAKLTASGSNPSETLNVLLEMVQVAPVNKKRQLETLIQFGQHTDDKCNLDYFMDIRSSFEDDRLAASSNLGVYLKFHRDQQFALCKSVLEGSVAQIGETHRSQINLLTEKIVNAGPGVDIASLSIPRENIPKGIVEFLKTQVTDQSGLKNKVVLGQLVLRNIGEACGELFMRLNPVTQVYRVGSSYKEIFGQDTIDQFIWNWLFNMQVCQDASAEWVMPAVFQVLNNNS